MSRKKQPKARKRSARADAQLFRDFLAAVKYNSPQDTVVWLREGAPGTPWAGFREFGEKRGMYLDQEKHLAVAVSQAVFHFLSGRGYHQFALFASVAVQTVRDVEAAAEGAFLKLPAGIEIGCISNGVVVIESYPARPYRVTPPCPRCGSTDTAATQTRGNRQYRECRNRACPVLGEKGKPHIFQVPRPHRP